MKSFLYLLVFVIFAGCSTIDFTSNTTIEITPYSGLIRSEFSMKDTTRIVSRGLYVSSTDEIPEKTNFNKIEAVSSQPNSFNTYLNDLKPDRTYYIRSYVKTEKKLFYSEPSLVTTKKIDLPQVDTCLFLRVSNRAAVVQSQFLSKGGDLSIECGFCYSMDPLPDLNDEFIIIENPTDTTFRGTITELNADKTYFIRSFVKNSIGVTYSEPIELLTKKEGAIRTTSPSGPDRERSMLALLHLGASCGFSCSLEGYAYGSITGEILGEYDESFIHNNDKTTSEFTDKNDYAGIQSESKVTKYYTKGILTDISISINHFTGHGDAKNITKGLINELDRQYGSSTIETINLGNNSQRIIYRWHNNSKSNPTGISVTELSNGARTINLSIRFVLNN